MSVLRLTIGLQNCRPKLRGVQLKNLDIRSITVYKLSDLGVSSNLIGSLSRTIEHYPLPWECPCKTEAKWGLCKLTLCQCFRIRHFGKYRTLQSQKTQSCFSCVYLCGLAAVLSRTVYNPCSLAAVLSRTVYNRFSRCSCVSVCSLVAVLSTTVCNPCGLVAVLSI